MKAMHKRLSQQLHINHTLITEQYAVRKGISTEAAVFRVTDSIFKSIKNTMHVGGNF